jgi:hypothetical protein
MKSTDDFFESRNAPNRGQPDTEKKRGWDKLTSLAKTAETKAEAARKSKDFQKAGNLYKVAGELWDKALDWNSYGVPSQQARRRKKVLVHSAHNEKMRKAVDDYLSKQGSLGESKEDLAANALRDMFQSQQYKAKVPVKDIEHVLKSPKWAKIYGKSAVKAAWKSLIDNDYVAKKGGHWVWTLGYMH